MDNDSDEARQRERIPTTIFPSSEEASVAVAAEIAQLIRDRNADNKPTVLGLATGSTPIGVYRELIRFHKEEGLSFASVRTFNLDEYYGLEPDHPESYAAFMRRHLFDHLDIPKDAAIVPDGTVPRAEVFEYCHAYEERIRQAGGLDIQVLGIGRTGHVGFNEPGSGRNSLTRLIHLDSLTRKDAARDFLGEENVPRYAITMGVGTILAARKTVMLAWGESKAAILAKAVEQSVSDSLPASFLQEHSDARVFVDEAAASELTRRKHPWLVGHVDWDNRITRRAVAWLSSRLKKPILKLTDEDYSEHGLSDLLTARGPAYDLNIRVFNDIQHTISGWPGGKPDADDTHRPEKAQPHPKRVLAIAPEPQDGVLALGGTLHRLVDQGHDVTVVFLTSGNLSVRDDDARRAADLIRELENFTDDSLVSKTREDLAEKAPFSSDAPSVRRLKGLLRRGEARSAMKTCGVSENHVRFLDLPFYEKGRYRNFVYSKDDVDALHCLLSEIRPHQIYLTGSHAEPSTVQAVCHACFTAAFERLRDEDWVRDCRCWNYRSADREWAVEDIDMAVPLSPDELANKTKAIYLHRSQQNQTPAEGSRSAQETWQQAKNADRRLAATYDALGLAEYEAMEAFSRHPS